MKRLNDQLPEFTPTEGSVVNACLRYLWQIGCYAWRQNTGAYKPEGSERYIRYGIPGCADIIGITPHGRFLACECKAGKNKQSDRQKQFQQYVEDHHGIYILAYSVKDLERQRHTILARVMPAGYADGCMSDYRVKPKHTEQMEEMGC